MLPAADVVRKKNEVEDPCNTCEKERKLNCEATGTFGDKSLKLPLILFCLQYARKKNRPEQFIFRLSEDFSNVFFGHLMFSFLFFLIYESFKH